MNRGRGQHTWAHTENGFFILVRDILLGKFLWPNGMLRNRKAALAFLRWLLGNLDLAKAMLKGHVNWRFLTNDANVVALLNFLIIMVKGEHGLPWYWAGFPDLMFFFHEENGKWHLWFAEVKSSI